jgi:hypothetical protein
MAVWDLPAGAEWPKKHVSPGLLVLSPGHDITL